MMKLQSGHLECSGGSCHQSDLNSSLPAAACRTGSHPIRALNVLVLILFAAWLAAGCSTDIVGRRMQERRAAYSNLPANQMVAVEQGRILPGMTTNAAYMAWGRPSEVISSGPTTTWLYWEQQLEAHKSITIRGGSIDSRSGFPEETSVLFPRNAVRAKIIFEDGLIREWSLTPPRSARSFY